MPVELALPETSQNVLAFPLPLPNGVAHKGFVECLFAVAPQIRAARERVRHGAEALATRYAGMPFDANTVDEILAAPLADQILQMMGRTLVLELNVARLEGSLSGSTPQEPFHEFGRRFRHPEAGARLFNEYPVLLDEIENRLDKWSAYSIEFLHHFCQDWQGLRETIIPQNPGMLTEIRGGAGDTHRNGRSVMVLRFESGTKLVYKPRTLALDQRFQELLCWLNEHGAEPGFQTMGVLTNNAHGWAEFIQPVSCTIEDELTRFYQRMGGYVAILYLLNGTDFHFENLIASGEHPFLIDLEALFHQNVEEPAEPIGRSVHNISLLPSRSGVGVGYDGVDLGGLSNPAGQLSPSTVPQWDQAGTDEMRLVRKRAEMPSGLNCPTLNGREARAYDYAAAVMAGFSNTYRLLLSHREELIPILDRFAGVEVRVIARATQLYGRLLLESFHPDLLRGGNGRQELFQSLSHGLDESEILRRLTPIECRDLLRGDIPMFTTQPRSCDLFSSDGERIPDVFPYTALELAKRQLQRFDDADHDRQLWNVRAALATLYDSSTSTKRIPTPVRISAAAQETFTREQALAAARSVADRLALLAIGPQTQKNWLGLFYVEGQKRFLNRLALDLYEGLPGVLLFLHYFDAITGEDRYRELASSGLDSLKTLIEGHQAWDGLGGFAGWGGVIYSIVHIGMLRNDPQLLAAAEAIVPKILRAVPSDNQLDVIGGSAGCALALRSLQSVRPSSAAVAAAAACGERLLAARTNCDHGIGWLCAGSPKTPLSGFAHGNAGIAYALCAVTQMTGDTRFHQAARDAIAYERTLFVPEVRNWRDLRQDSAAGFATAWCHGAPGIALGRLASLRQINDAATRAEIETGLLTTAATSFGAEHTLCHGDLGNADILLNASEITGDLRWRDHARQQAGRVLRSASASNWQCGNPLNVDTPGLMTGIAGIGYAFLRFADPARIPCVLALEPPRS